MKTLQLEIKPLKSAEKENVVAYLQKIQNIIAEAEENLSEFELFSFFLAHRALMFGVSVKL